MQMEDFLEQVEKDTNNVILDYSDKLSLRRDTLAGSINKLGELVKEFDNAKPQYIEHVLRRDKVIQLKSKLTEMLNTFDEKQSEMVKSVPFKYRVIHFFKKLFK